ncbi:MAG: ABC transporter ATP-binding protein [Salinarimonadaceae bacterium]|nr:MAG: ABC transporter ATP-binding protein [Salinarimonadaceae bacterium]
MIEVRDLSVRYGAVEALRGITLTAQPGHTTAVLGANGAGKSSLLRAISGISPVTGGEILLNSKAIQTVPPEKRSQLGLAHAMEGRRIFKQLAVHENLELAWSFGARKIDLQKGIREVYDRFPILGEKSTTAGGLLSGGQQQMLILSCATIRNPTHLLLDEPSLGLAPIIVNQIYDFIASFARDTGATVIIAEQMATMALKVSNYGYVLRGGKVVVDGESKELLRNGIAETLSSSYL